MFIRERNYIAPNFTTEDFRIQVRGPPVNYVYGCHVTPVTRGALGYVSYQKGIIQGHIVHSYATRKDPALCSRIVFRTVFSLNVRTYITRPWRILWGIISDVFWVHVTHWLLCQTNEANTIFQPFIGYIYGALVSSSAIANFCWLIQTFKYRCFGFQMHFKSFLVYNLKTRNGFWSKCPHYIMGYITILGLIFLLFSLVLIYQLSIVPNLNRIYSICNFVTIPINGCSSLFNRLKCC